MSNICHIHTWTYTEEKSAEKSATMGWDNVSDLVDGDAGTLSSNPIETGATRQLSTNI